MGSSEVELYATEDGGKHWSEIMETKSDHPIPGALPYAGQKTGTSFIDSQNGWSTGGVGWSDDLWFYETKGGFTWKQQILVLPNGYSDGEIDVVAPPPPVFFTLLKMGD